MTWKKRKRKFIEDIEEAFGEARFDGGDDGSLRAHLPGVAIRVYRNYPPETQLDARFDGFERAPIDRMPDIYRILRRDEKRRKRQVSI
jgi:hypothetical protein